METIEKIMVGGLFGSIEDLSEDTKAVLGAALTIEKAKGIAAQYTVSKTYSFVSMLEDIIKQTKAPFSKGLEVFCKWALCADSMKSSFKMNDTYLSMYLYYLGTCEASHASPMSFDEFVDYDRATPVNSTKGTPTRLAEIWYLATEAALYLNYTDFKSKIGSYTVSREISMEDLVEFLLLNAYSDLIQNSLVSSDDNAVRAAASLILRRTELTDKILKIRDNIIMLCKFEAMFANTSH